MIKIYTRISVCYGMLNKYRSWALKFLGHCQLYCDKCSKLMPLWALAFLSFLKAFLWQFSFCRINYKFENNNVVLTKTTIYYYLYCEWFGVNITITHLYTLLLDLHLYSPETYNKFTIFLINQLKSVIQNFLDVPINILHPIIKLLLFT